jgi:hypothetical protein
MQSIHNLQEIYLPPIEPHQLTIANLKRPILRLGRSQSVIINTSRYAENLILSRPSTSSRPRFIELDEHISNHKRKHPSSKFCEATSFAPSRSTLI